MGEGAAHSARTRWRWQPGRCARSAPAPSPRSARDETRVRGIARTTRTSPASCASTDGARRRAAGRSRQPFAHLALDHHQPQRRRSAAPRSCAAAHRPRPRRAGWRPPWLGSGQPLGRAHRVPPVHADVLEAGRHVAAARPAGARRSRPRAARRARGARYSLSTPSPPPISSTTSSGSELGLAPDHTRMLESTRKFWPSSRSGGSELAQAPQSRLDRQLPAHGAHQPNTRRPSLHELAQLGAHCRAAAPRTPACARRRRAGCGTCARPAVSGRGRRSPPAAARRGPRVAASRQLARRFLYVTLPAKEIA